MQLQADATTLSVPEFSLSLRKLLLHHDSITGGPYLSHHLNHKSVFAVEDARALRSAAFNTNVRKGEVLNECS